MSVSDEDVSHVKRTIGGCDWRIITAEKEHQAHAAIVFNLSDTQLMHVVRTENMRGAWIALARVHRTQYMASRLWLEEILHRFSTQRRT